MIFKKKNQIRRQILIFGWSLQILYFPYQFISIISHMIYFFILKYIWWISKIKMYNGTLVCQPPTWWLQELKCKKFPWFFQTCLEHFPSNRRRSNFLNINTFLLNNQSIYLDIISYKNMHFCTFIDDFVIYFNIFTYLIKIFKGWCFCQLDILSKFSKVEILSRYVFCPWLCFVQVGVLSVYR